MLIEEIQTEGDERFHLPKGMPPVTPERMLKKDLRYYVTERGGIEISSRQENLMHWFYDDGLIGPQEILAGKRYQRWRVSTLVSLNGQMEEYDAVEVNLEGEREEGFADTGYHAIVTRIPMKHLALVDRAIKTPAACAWAMGLDKKNEYFPMREVIANRTPYMQAFKALVLAMDTAMEIIMEKRKDRSLTRGENV